jgi:hypothetical protein
MVGFCISGAELSDSITRKIFEYYEDVLEKKTSIFSKKQTPASCELYCTRVNFQHFLVLTGSRCESLRLSENFQVYGNPYQCRSCKEIDMFNRIYI